MKRVLPENAKVSKACKEAMQEMVAEFICFVTSEANDLCRSERDGKRVIKSRHIAEACAALDLEMFVAPIAAARLPATRVEQQQQRAAREAEANEAWRRSALAGASFSSVGSYGSAGSSSNSNSLGFSAVRGPFADAGSSGC